MDLPQCARPHLLAGDMENIPLADGVADIVLANASFNLTVNKKKRWKKRTGY